MVLGVELVWLTVISSCATKSTLFDQVLYMPHSLAFKVLSNVFLSQIKMHLFDTVP